ncbi:MAG: non-ribosomal peptide synthetase, partial [Planctomycetota bacterium]|nr:non-ribosomal peptide synthetase [Planctomycetota bacterium]
TADVMASLPHLNELKRRCDERSAAGVAVQADDAATIPALIERHGVTHFQCTPSMASMLLHDPAALGALGRLEHMLVGGEALSAELAGRLRDAARQLHDVYGPTETTVWSTAWTVGDEDPVPIGRPLANQQVYVLDPNRQPVSTGDVGELWIGGDGVTAGYFKRPDLTEQRFRPDPFRAVDGARIYATGDLVRWRADGVLEYLGRVDTQVKVRGHRIELGEVEAALTLHPDVAEAVVVARGDGEDARLVAYVVQAGAAPAPDVLRAQLRAALPEFMVPSAFVALSELPRTPNMKVDRKALPEPGAVAAPAARELAAAADDIEAAILAIWRESLGTDDVGVEDNFFDSGGHSILAVKVHRAVTQRLDVDLAVTDLFRFTTVRALAAHLRAGPSAPTAAQQASARAKARRNILRR